MNRILLILTVLMAFNVQASDHAAAPAGVEPDKALQWLKNGNIRYLKGSVRKDGQGKKDRELNAKGQHPHAIVVSCSDSRVPPELIFDQKIGEIFVTRTAGESLDTSVLASVEYAVEHLGPRLIVVMGHESCGAVKAALDTYDTKKAGSPNLDRLVADLHPHLSREQAGKRSEGLLVEGRANASGVARDLISRSPIIKAAVESGKVKIVTSLYRLGSGEVEWGDTVASAAKP
jgi:carbonic anhydrase